MTLPKKNRHNIVVDGRSYHWHLNPSRFTGNDTFLCVQDASGRGPLLKIQWVGIALPHHIETAVRFAHESGWKPDGTLLLEMGANSTVEPVTFKCKPKGASRYWFYDEFYMEFARQRSGMTCPPSPAPNVR